MLTITTNEYRARGQSFKHEGTRKICPTCGQAIENTFHIGRMTVDGNSRRVYIDGNLVKLTTREFDVIYKMAECHPLFVPHDRMVDYIISDALDVKKLIQVHVSKLRPKLRPAAFIVCVWGEGYRFSVPDEE